MLKSFIDFLFPKECLSCKTKGTFLCKKCFLKIQGLPEKNVGEHIYALYSYRDTTVRRALWMLKFKGIRDIAKLFSEPLARLGENIMPQETPIFVVPIPTTKSSLRKRGYNQTSLIAKCLEDQKKERFQILDILKKRRGVKKQTDVKERKKRIENMRNAFMVSDVDAAHGKNILIIDDIITTGATAREAMRTLQNAGARNVYFVAIAYQELT